MAMRCSCVVLRGEVRRLMQGKPSIVVRYLSDGKVLGEEERAQEAIYIQKLEREKMEKMKKKVAEQDKLNKEDKSTGKADEVHKS